MIILINVLDGCTMKINNDTAYLCISSGNLSFMPEVVKLCATFPPLCVINTMLSLSKLLATLTFLSQVRYRAIFFCKRFYFVATCLVVTKAPSLTL